MTAEKIFLMTCKISIQYWIIGTIRIQIQPIAAVSVLLCKAGDDRVIEPCAQVVLLGDRVKLLAGELETVGDFFFTEICITPCIILITIEDNAISINNMGN